MTWRDRDRSRGPDAGNGHALWRKSDQHRFEDRLEERLDKIEASVDRLTSRQAWIAGGLAVVVFGAGILVRFYSGAP